MVGATSTGSRRERGLAFAAYDDLWRWSVADLDGFWPSIWDVLRGAAAQPARARCSADAAMPGAAWFPGATLNYAEHALRPWRDRRRRRGHRALADPRAGELTRGRAARPGRPRARRAAAARRRRRATGSSATCPTSPRPLVAFLATAEPRRDLGVLRAGVRRPQRASTASPRSSRRCCSPSTATATATSAIDRARRGRRDPRGAADAARTSCGAATATGVAVPDALAWDELLAEPRPSSAFEPVPFDHPLYVLFSSGTTGLPKAIVHGHGGILLEHLKTLGLHWDLAPGDRFFWFTTTGWMMWNYLVSGPAASARRSCCSTATRATPTSRTQWRLAAETGATLFGVERAVPAWPAARRASSPADAVRPLRAARRSARPARRCPPRASTGSTSSSARRAAQRRSAAAPTCAPASSAASPLLPVLRRRDRRAACSAREVDAFDADGPPRSSASSASW